MKLDTRKLGFLVKQKRGDRSLRDIEAETGVSISTLSRIERGKSEEIQIGTFSTICQWLGVAPGGLFGEQQLPPTPTMQEILLNGVSIRISVDVLPIQESGA